MLGGVEVAGYGVRSAVRRGCGGGGRPGPGPLMDVPPCNEPESATLPTH